jgi:hypothetical protein
LLLAAGWVDCADLAGLAVGIEGPQFKKSLSKQRERGLAGGQQAQHQRCSAGPHANGCSIEAANVRKRTAWQGGWAIMGVQS